ncbi:flagellar filament capping protein FliD [Noviherbaspirillum pedocola]|uniref:Flagellar hook-associated protein 2 n=1 Tax=Noviherbaspirillum pedocola TaxID=2801341 RepID=A0A934SMY0_9BURK|nr:flagellar filament capping protein FliD [Noviherbaspirillum pedocola]MBK4733516.1 flagellar filament capping protein FliD [Noviherbaspirillum pedocola]
MGISSPGIGSGLDVNSLVSQLMTQESQPLTLLQKKEATYQSQVSALGQVKSALSSFQSALDGLTDVKSFQAVKATVGDSAVMTASASSSAAPGSYALEVTQLAQAQKLVSAGQASTSAAIGTGTITFDFGTVSGGSLDASTGKYTGASFASSGSGSKSVTIDSTHATLSGIRDAINAAGMGVTASIVNDGSAAPNRLVLTNSATGAASSMKISVSGDAALSSLLSQDPAGSQAMQQTIAAQDAKFSIDGLAVTKPSNHVTDLIDGVTLDLTKTNAGSPTTLSVARDTASASSAVKKFVDAYNAASKTLTDATSYNAETKTAAVLNGDSTVRNLQTRMRSMLSNVVAGGGAYSRLADIGVSFQKDGTLALDSAKLNKALTSNFNDVASLFAVAGNASDALVSYQDATPATKAGTYAVSVSRLATQGSLVGSSALGSTTITAGVNDSLTVNLDGNSATITLKPGDYQTASALALQIESQINGNSAFSDSGVAVSADSSNVLSFTSNRYGSASKITLAGTAAANLVGASPVASDGVDVAGTINGMAASGSGQKLTGANGDASEGLSMLVTGGAIGDRGTIRYAKGYASQLDDLIAGVLDTDGSISAHTKGINAAIKAVQKQEDAMSQRLTLRETALRAQFNALDTQLSGLTATSTYLTQQLAAIKANSSSS